MICIRLTHNGQVVYTNEIDINSLLESKSISVVRFQVLEASNIALWWQMQYVPLKRRCISARLRGGISQKAVLYLE
jgi:hypothetical protein